MLRPKFYYDIEKMEYQKVSRKVRLGKTILFALSSFLFGFILLLILLNTPFVKTPRELSQEREIQQYKSKFEILNDKLGTLESVITNIEDRDNNIYRVFFETSPIPESQRRAGFGGVNRYKTLEGFKNSELIIKTIKRMEILQKQAVVESKSLDEILDLALNKENFLESIPAIQPIKNENLKRIASGFGMRTDPFTKIKKMHKGMDFSAPKSTPVYATGNGKVLRADSRSAGYGNHIRISHLGGYITLYGHLSKILVKKGQRVKRGELIGLVGSTGRSQGSHLHYEVRKGRKHINPINFYYGSLSPTEYEQILNAANEENQSFD